MILFRKVYDDESLYDLDRDIQEAIAEEQSSIPVDEYGFRKGSFTVTIEWRV